MSMTRSIEFYCGKRTKEEVDIFGRMFKWYEFSKDIAYSNSLTFSDVSKELRVYMEIHNIKVGYCDISCDFGGGYSLFKRYKFINKKGKVITSPIRYCYGN